MTRYQDAGETHIALAEAARKVHRLYLEARRGGDTHAALRRLAGQVDEFIALYRSAARGRNHRRQD